MANVEISSQSEHYPSFLLYKWPFLGVIDNFGTAVGDAFFLSHEGSDGIFVIGNFVDNQIPWLT